ncbi:hypothetical protein [Rhizobium sp. BE258]|uniref:hypothetical protein n=1 Tax=Rhizobium sp. BE258 TaxID=2817722 RepID=UPI00285D1482|nr:hypothetical protein [Rhizobium sp. BE258]MDR7145291.1 endonuclease YncB(thermonuclease family) [Rhizobium sp. BE258]
MNGFAAASGKIAMSIGLVFIAMGAASAVTERPVKATVLDTQAQPVWTSIPVRVDRSKQTYERIAGREAVDAYPIKFRAGTMFTIIDGATFEANGVRIVLAGAKPLERRKICEDAGKRTACGTRAFVIMTKALRGKFVDCRAVADGLFECRSNGRKLSQLLAAINA